MNVLYTGAASGIAREVLLYLKEDEHIVWYLTVHNNEQLKRVKKLYEHCPRVIAMKLDITKEEDYHQLDGVDIDVVIHNAAISYGGSLFEIPIPKIKENYDTNVFGTLQLTQYLFLKFQKQRHGRIIFMASLAGIMPLSFIGSYASSKASLIMIARILKNEAKMLDFPLDVIIVEPGLYHTGFNQLLFESKDEYMKNRAFLEQRDQIDKKEKLLLRFLEKRNMKSIVRQISRAIYDPYPFSIYRAPLLQSIGAKIYQILFW